MQRAYLCQTQSLAAAFSSEVADFNEMARGAVQWWWDGEDNTTGETWLEASVDAIHWAPIPGSRMDLSEATKSNLWDRRSIGFRYLRLCYTPNTTTTGTLTAVAVGKAR
jgi:hypothetical protein